MSSELIHPSQLIETVRFRRGLPSGPRADVYVQDQELPPPDDRQVVVPEEAKEVDLPVVDHVRGGLREAYFMGSQVFLTEEEAKELRRLLGNALVRQLGDQVARIKQAAGLGADTVPAP